MDVLVRGFGPSRNNDDNLDDPILTWKTNPASLLPDSSGIVAEVDNADDNARLSGANSTAQELLDVLVDKGLQTFKPFRIGIITFPEVILPILLM